MRRSRILGMSLLAGALLVWLALPASADGTVSWTGHGAEHLEDCGEGGTIHWVLALRNGTATSATLTVDGEVLSMEKMSASANDGTARHAFSTFTGDDPVASVSWVGTATRANLVISDCEPYPPNATAGGFATASSERAPAAGGLQIPLLAVILAAAALAATVGPVARRIRSSRAGA